MSDALEELVGLLTLEQLEVDLFRGVSPRQGPTRIFGGQVAGQALIAAGRTVAADRPVHSLHGYFLRPGDPSIPVVYSVDHTRDGRSFTTRRVLAIQKGEVIFSLAASFHSGEPGPEFALPMPQVPAPETLRTWQDHLAPYREKLGAFFDRPRPIDLRYVIEPPIVGVLRGDAQPRAEQCVWLRTDGRLPDDPLLHVCAVVYASDITLLESTLLPHGLAFGSPKVLGASLDHAMWFHRQFRADDWLLYQQEAVTSGGARGFGTGRLFTADGRLVVSVAQEGVLRIVDR